MFRTETQPAASASSSARSVVACGISSWQRSTPAPSKILASISSGDSSKLAPGTTTMEFVSSSAPTATKATPVGAVFVVCTLSMITPRSRKFWRAAAPIRVVADLADEMRLRAQQRRLHRLIGSFPAEGLREGVVQHRLARPRDARAARDEVLVVRADHYDFAWCQSCARRQRREAEHGER